MQMRPLTPAGPQIAPIVFGGNVFGWTADTETSFRIIDRFLDTGFNAIDTADVYAAFADGMEGGDSETVIGEWIASRKRREDIVLMSKVGMWSRHKGLSKTNILEAVDDSLKRLKTDYLDVYFAHYDDEETPLEETLSAFDELKRQGKIRIIGASNYDARRLSQALQVSKDNGLARYEVLQPHYNLYTRDSFEGELDRTAKENGLAVTTYFSLASGFLTGKYASKSDIEGTSREKFLGDYFDNKGQRVLAALKDVAGDLGAKPSQVALAWLIAKDGVTAPIASATSVEQLDETLGAAKIELSSEQMRRLDEAGSPS